MKPASPSNILLALLLCATTSGGAHAAVAVENNHVEITSVKGGAFCFDGWVKNFTLTGDVVDNSAVATAGDALGGVIYVGEGTNLTLTGDLKDNYAEASGDALGGALHVGEGSNLNLTGDLKGNHAASTTGEASGGAVYHKGSVGTVEIGELSGNYAEGATKAAGGAVHYAPADPAEAGVVVVTGDVADNHASASAGGAYGGAVYVGEGAELVLRGDVKGNYAEASGDALGGALHVGEGSNLNLTGDLKGNHAASTTGEASGGAVYHKGSAGTLEIGDLSGNYAEGATKAAGGAVHYAPADPAEAGVVVVTGDVVGNHAAASAGGAYGGAVYVGEGTELVLRGDVAGNYAEASGEALGGAIYNAGTTTFEIEGKDAVVSGNYASSAGTKESNVLYAAAGSATNFNLTNASLRVDDGIRGETGYEVNVTGNGIGSATFFMHADFKDSDLSFDNVTLSTINDEIHVYSVNRLTVKGDFDMVADVDLKQERMDRFVTSGNNYGEAKGKLNVAGMNLISDTDKDVVAIYFAEPGLKENVTSSVETVPDGRQQTVYAPIYEYSLSYDKNDDGSLGEDGGYFVFSKTDRNNPAVMASSVAQMGAYNAMALMFEYNFEHSDYYMKLPGSSRLAAGDDAAEGDDGTKPRRRVRQELTKGGGWVKPFFSEDKVSYRGGYSSRDKRYGALVGVDSDLHESESGWASVFTAYMGCLGVRQTYSGGNVDQHGGVVGATASFYKGDFYSAWTAAFSSMKANAHTMYGREYTRSNIYGVASKSGWHFDSDDGKYSFLPTFTASYTYVDTRDFDNAAGVHVDPHGMHAIQLKPNAKFLVNLENGLQPYLTVGEVWTVAQSASVYADGNRLAEELSLKPYTEYGGGVQKRWEEHGCDAYVEVLGHAGGRRGVAATAGLRWDF